MSEETNHKTNAILQRKSDDLDVVEFCIGEKHYGVSILQIREIVRASIGMVPVSDAHPSISGVVNLRREIIPIINLATHFSLKMDESDDSCRIIISESHGKRIGFLVGHVANIHRISMSDAEPPPELIRTQEDSVFGMTKLEDRILFLIDLEKIADTIKVKTNKKDTGGAHPETPDVDFDRSEKKILIAEDSPFMRNLLVQYVKKAGYNVINVNNGFEAWQILEGTTKLPDFTDIANHYHLLITDIEMPQMDGLDLIRNIRQNEKLKKLPCIVFSSLITNDMLEKCNKVGADDAVTKPEIGRLINSLDDFVIK